MNDTEQLIKEALNRQADRAPHPGPTLSALRRPARKRSRSSIFLTVGVAAAAAAVMFTAGVLVGKGPSPNEGAAALMPTATPNAATPLKYGPKWLPDGYVEIARSAGANGVHRTWSKDGKSTENADYEPIPRVSVSTGGSHLPVGYQEWEKVPVRKGSGYFHLGELPKLGSVATVIVTEPEVVVITAHSVPNARDLVLQVANSVEPDANATVRSAVEHNGMSVPDVSGRSPSEWKSRIQVNEFTAVVSSQQPDVAGGTEVVVRTRKGSFVPGYVKKVVVQDQGVWLTVSSTEASEDQLVAFANEVKIDPKPDYSWLGGRP